MQTKQNNNDFMGTCFICNKQIKRRSISRHVQSCSTKMMNEYPSDIFTSFYLFMEDMYSPNFWMVVEIKEMAKLWKLAGVIDHAWMEECCDHCSGFEIKNLHYGSSPYGDTISGMQSMGTEISKALQPILASTKKRKEFVYEYDFGYSSNVKLKIIKQSKGVFNDKTKAMDKANNDDAQILARNNKALIMCEQCNKKEAEWLIKEFNYKYCLDCAKIAYKDLSEELFYPILNSPRTGICEYIGQDFIPMWKIIE